MVYKQTYHWRKGFPNRGVDAQVAGRTLERLRKETGSLKPSAIVAAARAKSNPLHPFFEWDDATAAKAHREEQARSLTRSIMCKVEIEEGKEPVEVRAFVSIPNRASIDGDEEDDGGQVYVRTRDALAKPALRQFVLDRALGELRGWQERWGVYNELAKLIIGVGDLIADVEGAGADKAA